MAEAKYDEPKPYMNTGTIDYVDHGKAMLTAIITKVLADKYPELNEFTPFDEVDNVLEERQRGITTNVSHAEYQTDKRRYAHADAPGYVDHIKNMTTGVVQTGDVILVVAVTDGPVAQARRYVLPVHQAGVPSLTVALNKVGMIGDKEILKLAEVGVHEPLSSQEYDGDSIPVVYVPTLEALSGDAERVSSIEEFMDEVDSYLPDSVHDFDKPSLMPIEDAPTITGRRAVATGRAECDLLNVNEEVEILGVRLTWKTVVTGIETFHRQMDHADVGKNCGLLLRGIKCEEVERGQVVARPGTIIPRTNFEARVYALEKEEGGRYNPFFSNHRPQLHLRIIDVTGVITLPEGTEVVTSGDNTEMMVGLIQPVAMEEGLGFIIREDGYMVGSR